LQVKPEFNELKLKPFSGDDIDELYRDSEGDAPAAGAPKKKTFKKFDPIEDMSFE